MSDDHERPDLPMDLEQLGRILHDGYRLRLIRLQASLNPKIVPLSWEDTPEEHRKLWTDLAERFADMVLTHEDAARRVIRTGTNPEVIRRMKDQGQV